MRKWLKAFLRRREYPLVNKYGWRMKIVGDGVIKVDLKTVFASERFKEICEKLKDVKTE